MLVIGATDYIFLNVSKVFDRMWREGVVKKLKQISNSSNYRLISQKILYTLQKITFKLE